MSTYKTIDSFEMYLGNKLFSVFVNKNNEGHIRYAYMEEPDEDEVIDTNIFSYLNREKRTTKRLINYVTFLYLVGYGHLSLPCPNLPQL